MISLGSNLKEKLQKALIHPSILKGCTEEEVARLESKWAQPFGLPPTYKEFLLTMGHGVTGFGFAEEFWYEALHNYQMYYHKYATEGGLMGGKMDGKFPPNGFVIGLHDAHNWWIIRLDSGNNSPVLFLEDDDSYQFKILYPTIQEFALDMVEQVVESVGRIQKNTQINLSHYLEFVLKCHDWMKDRVRNENQISTHVFDSVKKILNQFLNEAYLDLLWKRKPGTKTNKNIQDKIYDLREELNKPIYQQINDPMLHEIIANLNALWEETERCAY